MNLRARLLPWLAPVLALAVMGQGCGGGQQAQGPDGGVFRTASGETWTQLKTLVNEGKIGSIASVALASLAVDPQDNNAIYAGTVQDGILYTLDGGTSWMRTLGAGRSVVSLTVHPKNKCVVYGARANQVIKTETCTRDWKQVYFDPRTDKMITAVAVDWYNPANVYAATSDGDIIKSENDGQAWRVVNRIEGGIKLNNIVIDPRDSRIVYVSTFGQGILKTTDGGTTWTRIRDELKDSQGNAFDGARRTVMVQLDPNNAGRVYHLSKYGIIRSDDAGATWTALQLPTPPGSVDLIAFAVNPKDPKQLVYVTPSSIVMSADAGITWTTKKLPTSRAPSVLMYDNGNPPSLYLGTALPKE